MKPRTGFRLLLSALFACGLPFAASGQDVEPKPPIARDAEPKPKEWLTKLADGLEASRTRKQPILVRAGADWCGWCKRLDKEIVDPAVQAELAKWVLVEIDVDDSPEEAERLGIGPIPALRILDAAGRTVRSSDGYMPAEDLLRWLQGKEPTGEGVTEPIAEIPPLSGDTLPQLIRLLAHRDAAVREAVARSLAADRKTAGPAVVEAFIKGGLVTRLTTLEMLALWKAPVVDLDPWRPQTMTSERLSALEDWIDSEPGDAPPAATMLTPEELEAAQREIAKLATADPTEMEAIGARLAHHGPLLLPEVQRQRERAASEAARGRLDWLRYRLAASDTLAFKWPEGLLGLAAAEAPRRQAAAAELKEVVTPGDEALLIELLHHPDPLVRELSLKALHGVDGARSREELVKLLTDPEANVRAAVLKEMAEKPDEKLVPQILTYIETEKDADLLVYAIRMLQEVKNSDAARQGLLKLLKHASWQVRAEALEGIAKSFPSHSWERRNQSKEEQEKLVDGYSAVLELLDDEDGYVVSRAVLAMKASDMAAAVEPLAQTAESHPELASAVMEALAAGEATKAKSEKVLHGWLKHTHENLRAAAIKGLQQMSQLDGEEDLLPALSDSQEVVRIAACRALLDQLDDLRDSEQRQLLEIAQSGDQPARPRPSGFGGFLRGLLGGNPSADPAAPEGTPPPGDSKAEAEDKGADAAAKGDAPPPIETWLIEFRAGQHRPSWTSKGVEPLKAMLASESLAERVPAGIALTALGNDAALAPLIEIVRKDANQLVSVGEVLGWLPFAERKATFQALRGLVRDRDGLTRLALWLTSIRDPRAADLLWDVLREPETNAELAHLLLERLMHLHQVEFDHYGYGNRGRSQKSLFDIAALQPHVASRNEWECRAALAALVQTDPASVPEAARAIYEDPARPDGLREDAFAIRLYVLDPQEARAEATAALVSGDRLRTASSLTVLALEQSALQNSTIEGFPLPANQFARMDIERDKPPVRPPLPEELTADVVRPLLESSDRTAALLARYILAIQGEQVDLGPLIAHWRAQGSPDYRAPRWDRLVYEAVAERNSPSDVLVLEEVYRFIQAEHGQSQLRDFYWTIRTMTGPEVLALRKRIRTEVGMGNLQ